MYSPVGAPHLGVYISQWGLRPPHWGLTAGECTLLQGVLSPEDGMKTPPWGLPTGECTLPNGDPNVQRS